MTPNIEIVRCCVSKILKMTSTDLDNQCFKNCSWIPLTMDKSLFLNSALLEIRIPAQLLIVRNFLSHFFGLAMFCFENGPFNWS